MKKVELEDGQSADIVSENISKLKELFPDAFSEGGVNFDTLRQLLGDASVLDEGEEKYGLNWHGKKKARQIALTPSTGTLLPCPNESVDWENTQNLFIEGDNLEVLKLLQKSYANKIKMIYIDPPYNTGNEFIYPDRFQENLGTYLHYTGQVDEEGMKLSSSIEYRGRRHTSWLNMMYSRVKLGRSLLKESGVFFSSIDHNEHSNLKALLDEVFGEENYLGEFVWQSKKGGGSDNPLLVTDHEVVVCYAKNIDYVELGSIEVNAEPLNLEDEKGKYRRGRELNKWGANSRREDRPTMYFPIKGPSGEDVFPIRNDGAEGCWRWGKKKMLEVVRNGDVEFSRREDGTYIVYEKIRNEENRSKPFRTWMNSVGTTADGSNAVKNLFDGVKVFSFPKPLSLLKELIDIGVPKDGIVLDFFAGSGSTAHAVIEVNAKRASRSIRHINIQLPEKVGVDTEAYKSGYHDIAALSRERIRRAAKDASVTDQGFRAFKLSYSNIKLWTPEIDDLEQSLLSHEEHLVEGRTEQDVLYELLLKRGVDLAVPIESREVSGKNIYSIGYGVLFACLDESITKDQVEEIAQAIIAWHGELAPSSETHVFFRDSAFRDDISKTNMAAILEQNGITHVRSL